MPKFAVDKPHAVPAAEVAAALACDPAQGLSLREAARRRRLHGPNRLRAQKAKSAVTILVHQFNSIIVWLLAAAAAISFAFGDLPEAAAIVVVLLINGTIGFFTELRAARSMESLLRIAEVRTLVRRAGKAHRIDARDLVPGDIVILDAGDMVTADLRLIEASNLQSDESVLTGESVPVVKGTAPVGAEAEIGDRASMVYKGSAITQGAGLGIVVATGMATEVGRISALVEASDAEVTPLERRLDRLGHRLVWLTLGLAGVMVAVGVLRGHPPGDMLQT
ncbi:MAG: cation-transporting P-type ATPase, partial [Rhodobacteraceae bacterium]|nr:cation-transporting P-type ATPase [Paracoccaceae bacterium]